MDRSRESDGWDVVMVGRAGWSHRGSRCVGVHCICPDRSVSVSLVWQQLPARRFTLLVADRCRRKAVSENFVAGRWSPISGLAMLLVGVAGSAMGG